jgi:hypothetical protein
MWAKYSRSAHEQAEADRARRRAFSTTTVVPFIRNSPSAGEYVRFWQRARAHTAAGGTVKLEWCGPALDAAAFTKEMRGALDRRINLRGGLTSDGRTGLFRKTDADHERCARLEAYEVRNLVQHRVWPARYRFQTPEFQKRYGHLLVRDPY